MNKKIQILLTAAFLVIFTHSWAASPWAKPEPIPAAEEEDTATLPEATSAETTTVEPVVTETTAEESAMPAQQAEAPAPVEEQTSTSGDTLAMPEPVTQETEAQPSAVVKLDFPRRGMTEDKVQSELGRPMEVIPAIGTPPITRWVYNDRIVYFEHSTVIHAVAK